MEIPVRSAKERAPAAGVAAAAEAAGAAAAAAAAVPNHEMNTAFYFLLLLRLRLGGLPAVSARNDRAPVSEQASCGVGAGEAAALLPSVSTMRRAY